jgi:hypothetical protein
LDYQLRSFRHAHEILSGREVWRELDEVITSIRISDVVGTHVRIGRERQQSGKRPPAGGQTAMNGVFRDALLRLRWAPEPKLFGPGRELAAWAMDFIKRQVGVEVSFNHAEAIPWTLTRLTLAGESPDVEPSSAVDVGVAIYATRRFKTWAKMDSAVGTFDKAWSWLELMRPVLPIPILMVGVEPATDGALWDDDASSVFRGTKSFEELFQDWQSTSAGEDDPHGGSYT